MREAIGENPTEGERIKLYGLRFETYLPHFYLGAAYLNLGNCDSATKSFETSRSQGAIRNHPKWPELLDGLKSCEGSGPAPKPPPPAPTLTPTTTTKPGPGRGAGGSGRSGRRGSACRPRKESGRAVAQLAADPRLAPSGLASRTWAGRRPRAGRRWRPRARSSTRDVAAPTSLLLGEAREQADASQGETRARAPAAERKARVAAADTHAHSRDDAEGRPKPGRHAGGPDGRRAGLLRRPLRGSRAPPRAGRRPQGTRRCPGQAAARRGPLCPLPCRRREGCGAPAPGGRRRRRKPARRPVARP